ncbi:hypothetical protein [Streptomyces sp. SAI-149]|nr:hypothetical protein [Streptomyces sp. SAI-149]MDH6493802.1 hypothetical protein [Streptomyces sp. SAI-149]
MTFSPDRHHAEVGDGLDLLADRDGVLDPLAEAFDGSHRAGRLTGSA